MKRSIGLFVSILYRKQKIFLKDKLLEFDLTPAELHILLALYNKDEVSQDALGEYLSSDKAGIARTIKELENKNYIYRKKDEDDKRVNVVCLTDKAKGIEPILKERLKEWTDFILEGFSKEDVDKIFEMLEIMANKVKNIKGEEI